jgi:hypothetical protein
LFERGVWLLATGALQLGDMHAAGEAQTEHIEKGLLGVQTDMLQWTSAEVGSCEQQHEQP